MIEAWKKQILVPFRRFQDKYHLAPPDGTFPKAFGFMSVHLAGKKKTEETMWRVEEKNRKATTKLLASEMT